MRQLIFITQLPLKILLVVIFIFIIVDKFINKIGYSMFQ